MSVTGREREGRQKMERRRYQEPVICVDDVRTMNVICGSLTGLESDSGNEGGELEP